MSPALESGSTVPIIAGFFIGGAAFVIMDFVTSRQDATRTIEIATVSTALYVGLLVDMLLDGVVIGLGSSLTLGAGLLLALSIAISSAPLALVTISLARHAGVSRRSRQLLFALFFIAIVGGALFGYLVLRNQSLDIRFLMVAIASGFLITTVTQSIIPEANKDGEPSLAALFFVAGLSLYTLFTLQTDRPRRSRFGQSASHLALILWPLRDQGEGGTAGAASRGGAFAPAPYRWERGRPGRDIESEGQWTAKPLHDHTPVDTLDASRTSSVLHSQQHRAQKERGL